MSFLAFLKINKLCLLTQKKELVDTFTVSPFFSLMYQLRYSFNLFADALNVQQHQCDFWWIFSPIQPYVQAEQP